jgi:HEAT repeat protein
VEYWRRRLPLKENALARSLALLLFFFAPMAVCQGFLDRMVDRDREAYHREQISDLARASEPRRRIEAAEWLAVQGEPRDVEALAGALADRDAKVRQAVASGLWKLEKRAEPAREALQRALADADPNVIARAAGALQALGMPESELAGPRRRVLAAPDATSSSRFLVARNLLGLEPATALVRPMLDYLDEWGRPNAAFRLTDAGEKNVELAEHALEKLVTQTQDRTAMAAIVESLEARRGGQVAMIHTLGLFEPRPPQWTALLVRQLDSPNPHVRYAALAQLRQAKDENDIAAFVPRVTALLDDRESLVRSQAAWVLQRAGGLAASAIPRIERALEDPEESVRNNARDALAAIRAAQPNFSAATPREAEGKKVLRARGVNFEQTDFFAALMQVDVELVRAFLDAGMSPKDAVSSVGPPIRAMLFAGRACAMSERPTRPATMQVVRMLIERGADPNGTDANGNTPLMEAASKGCDRELVRTLIKAGARIDAKNSVGLTPFEMGLYSGNDGLEELIAAGYRLPPEKAKAYTEGYKGNPASLALIRKASAPARK